ncbi:hypothetical protein N483_14455 [Pseudoalteromonas luteoviolacea NCIMB 1944]|nr:hypothetical protein N483_14455 [Pseudoalteromonas luteoviolacea NCIMB 1944]
MLIKDSRSHSKNSLKVGQSNALKIIYYCGGKLAFCDFSWQIVSQHLLR